MMSGMHFSITSGIIPAPHCACTPLRMQQTLHSHSSVDELQQGCENDLQSVSQLGTQLRLKVSRSHLALAIRLDVLEAHSTQQGLDQLPAADAVPGVRRRRILLWVCSPQLACRRCRSCHQGAAPLCGVPSAQEASGDWTGIHPEVSFPVHLLSQPTSVQLCFSENCLRDVAKVACSVCWCSCAIQRHFGNIEGNTCACSYNQDGAAITVYIIAEENKVCIPLPSCTCDQLRRVLIGCRRC